jgi:protein-disulfide isomerase
LLVGAILGLLFDRFRDSLTLPRSLSRAEWVEFVAADSMSTREARWIVVEFVDYQCPVCAAVERPLEELEQSRGREVARRIRHFPLSANPHSLPAAIAVEYSDDMPTRRRLHARLLGEQDQIGRRPWWYFASKAGVIDSVRFEQCLRDRNVRQRVELQRTMGRRLGVRGTPTFAVNRRVMTGLAPTEIADRILGVRPR